MCCDACSDCSTDLGAGGGDTFVNFGSGGGDACQQGDKYAVSINKLNLKFITRGHSRISHGDLPPGFRVYCAIASPPSRPRPSPRGFWKHSPAFRRALCARLPPETRAYSRAPRGRESPALRRHGSCARTWALKYTLGAPASRCLMGATVSRRALRARPPGPEAEKWGAFTHISRGPPARISVLLRDCLPPLPPSPLPPVVSGNIHWRSGARSARACPWRRGHIPGRRAVGNLWRSGGTAPARARGRLNIPWARWLLGA